MNVTLQGIIRTRQLGPVALAVISAPGFQGMFAADLSSVFFNLGEFAETVQYYHQGGPAAQYAGIFEDPSSYGTPGDLPAVMTRPQVQLHQEKLVAAVRKGDQLAIRGTLWNVLDVNQDGVGVTTLFIERA